MKWTFRQLHYLGSAHCANMLVTINAVVLREIGTLVHLKLEITHVMVVLFIVDVVVLVFIICRIFFMY